MPREWELRLTAGDPSQHLPAGASNCSTGRWRAEQDKFGRAGPAGHRVERGGVRGRALRAIGVQNALGELERLGLIEVVRAQGRAPAGVPAPCPNHRVRRGLRLRTIVPMLVRTIVAEVCPQDAERSCLPVPS